VNGAAFLAPFLRRSLSNVAGSLPVTATEEPMKLLTALAFALTMAAGIGAASACEDYLQMATYTPLTEEQIAQAELKMMVMSYLEEISAEHQIG
jgi:hypothetical protein